MDKVRMVDSGCSLNSRMELGCMCEKVEIANEIRSLSSSTLEVTPALEVSAADDEEMESPNLISYGGFCFVSEHKAEVHVTDSVTPSTDCENSEFSTHSDQADEEILSSGRETPKGSIFDPFAPGPEELAFAPKKKALVESCVPICRRLNFDSCISSSHQEKHVDNGVEEGQLQDLISKSILEVAVQNQLRQISGENVLKGIDSSKKFLTPTLLPLLTGVAENCPAAPAYKTVGMKYRKLSPSICRKLF